MAASATERETDRVVATTNFEKHRGPAGAGRGRDRATAGGAAGAVGQGASERGGTEPGRGTGRGHGRPPRPGLRRGGASQQSGPSGGREGQPGSRGVVAGGSKGRGAAGSGAGSGTGAGGVNEAEAGSQSEQVSARHRKFGAPAKRLYVRDALAECAAGPTRGLCSDA